MQQMFMSNSWLGREGVGDGAFSLAGDERVGVFSEILFLIDVRVVKCVTELKPRLQCMSLVGSIA